MADVSVDIEPDGPGFHERAATVIAGMIEEVDESELTTRVERLLLTSEIEATVVQWTEQVTASSAFGSLAERLGVLLDDPNLQAELLAIVAGTAAHRTAQAVRAPRRPGRRPSVRAEGHGVSLRFGSAAPCSRSR